MQITMLFFIQFNTLYGSIVPGSNHSTILLQCDKKCFDPGCKNAQLELCIMHFYFFGSGLQDVSSSRSYFVTSFIFWQEKGHEFLCENAFLLIHSFLTEKNLLVKTLHLFMPFMQIEFTKKTQ